MKHIIVLLFFLHVSSGNSQAPFNCVNTGGPDGSLKSYILSNDKFAFVPEYDFLYRTSDGVQWEAIEHIVSGRMSAYKDTLVNIFYDRDPSAGHLQVSYDNGSTWLEKDIPNGLDVAYADLVICSHGLYVYILTSNLLYHSTDLGDSWNLIPHQGIRGISMFVFDNRLYISDEQFLGRTDTTGKNWEIITPPLLQSHIIADVVASGPHLLVQTTGTGNDKLFHSHNDAQTWDAVPMKGGSDGDYIQQAGNKVYAYSNLYFLVSADFGASWDTLQEINITLAPFYFTGLRDTFLFTTFDKGVFRWDESTQAIEESNAGLSKGYVYDLCTFGDKIWASTGNGIYVYSRQSKTWNRTATLPDQDLRYNFIVVNDDGFLVLADQMQNDFYLSEDGGYTWQEKSIPQDYLGVFWIEWIGDYIYVLTDLPEVIRSPDYGETWEYLLQDDYMLTGITEFKSKYYMAGVDHLYSSADEGESWQSVDLLYEVYSLGAFGDELFAVARNNGVKELYISLDGISWRYAGEGFPQDYPTDLFFRNKLLFYRDAGYYYVFNADIYNQIYSSPVDSIAWAVMPFTKPLQLAEHPYDCVFENDQIYLGGQGVYQSILEDPYITAVDDLTENSNAPFTISPNPANDLLTITTDPTFNFHSPIRIYSSDGKLMKSIVTSPDAQQIDVIINDLPDGIYFVSLQGENGRAVNSFVKGK